MTGKVNAKSSMMDIEVKVKDITPLFSLIGKLQNLSIQASLQEEMNLKNVAYAFIARKGLMKEFRKFQENYPASFEDGNS